MNNSVETNQVSDQSVRDELLNPFESFIVQAPAGSGKTELLTQRILALLAVVEKPENILAITFTRKAAAEMRNRVVSALQLGQQPQPSASHEKKRWDLAQKVIQRDTALGWNLLENSSRLNITTIDSLSSSLSNALPLLSQTGVLPKVEENAQSYYLQAAQALIESVAEDNEYSSHILTLLQHKDNNVSQVIELVAQMLAKRLQWIGSVTRHSRQFDSASLIESFEVIMTEKLQKAYAVIPTDILCELPELLNQASEVLVKKGAQNKVYICQLEPQAAIKFPQVADLPTWKAIAELFLKAAKKPEVYTSFNVKNGFPTAKDASNVIEEERFSKNKSQVLLIAEQLKTMPEVVDLLDQIRQLPDDVERSFTQEALHAAVALLPIAVGHLKLIFKQYNLVDFSELAIASLNALGHADSPSDLALVLDHRLEHILIDEFQDTSTPQIELIKMLTAGWDDSLQRSLFLVGDPMQSIYRFRDANVSLFMQIREQGLEQIKILPRNLEVNFRSNFKIVNWVNQQFSQLMPELEDLTYSAVSYAPSVAFHQQDVGAKVETYLTIDAESHWLQAEKILEIVKSHLASNAKRDKPQTLAILARGRGHLVEIIELLNQHSIVYQAVEIDRLSQKMVVKDITNLAFALCDDYDQLSWVSCMRSPWFGLSLNDIRLIMTTSDNVQPMLQRIKAASNNISTLGQERCQRILPLLEAARQQKGKKPFKKWLFGCFKALGGMYQLDYSSEQADLIVCVEKLATLQQGGELGDRKKVNEAIERLFAAPNPLADAQIQVMTIHKSKGLEFDTVILPRLDAMKPGGDSSLLKWTEVVDEQGDAHNLLAISRETGQNNDPVYQFISFLDSKKSFYEDQRVLYVAATRAKQNLILLGNLKQDLKKGEIKTPPSGSFLNMLWPGIKDNYSVILAKSEAALEQHNLHPSKAQYDSRQIKRVNLECAAKLPKNVRTTNCLEALNSHPDVPLEPQQRDLFAAHTIGAGANAAMAQSQATEFAVTSDIAVAIGTVMHRQLQWISENYQPNFKLPPNWPELTRTQLVSLLAFSLPEELQNAIDAVVKGVTMTLEDPLGKMIVGPNDDAASELVLHKKIEDGGVLTRIIDRTFIKDEVRWIVDYKSSTPEKGESLAQFLQREKQVYFVQLSDYFRMFSQLEKRPIRCGLYFPLLSHFEVVIES
ncbi:UvrD-helicase domain-containing protein [Aliikangiella sp. IMCC44632]